MIKERDETIMLSGKWKVLQWAIIIILSLVTVVGTFGVYGKGKEIEDLKEQKSDITVPDKNKFSKQLTQSDVENYEKKVEEKLDGFLRNDLKEGTFNKDNSGVQLIRAIFSPGGIMPISEDQSQQKFLDHYSQFDYDIKNTFVSENSDGSADVYVDISVKFKGKSYNEQYDLAKFVFDKDGNLIGGSEYEKQ